MTVVRLNKYGAVLTGREYGKDVAAQILRESKAPFAIDFSGVAVVGSSFGDELVLALANASNKKVSCYNMVKVVKKCIDQIALENPHLTLHFESEK